MPVIETYGMTEAASQITANPLQKAASVGRSAVRSGLELEVRGEDGRRCARRASPGHVHIHGPQVDHGVRGRLGCAHTFDT